MKLLIKNGVIVDPANNIEEKLDIFVANGKIFKVGKNLSDRDAKIIDAKNCIVAPGFVDMHSHFREPGFEYKETIESGSRAAAKGGYTTVCVMPNTSPAIDNQAMVEFINMKSKQVGLIDVYTIGTITKGREGKELSPIGELVAAGAVAISDDGNSVMNAELLRRALEYAKMFNIPVIEHCEDADLAGDGVMNEGYYSTLLGLKGIPKAAEEVIIARDILLARETGGILHIAHVSTEGSIELIKWAKKQGIKVSCEVAPHHFSLDESYLKDYDTNFKMNPPLRTKEDIKAIKKALKEDLIEVIATDHAPHAELDKNVEFNLASYGIVGLETAFPLICENLIKTGVLSLSQAIAKITINPSRILNIKKGTLTEGEWADIVVANVDKEVMITKDFFASRSTNSPFIGQKLRGSIEHVVKKGKVIYSAKV
jgi:dihydroorotase